jgi:ribosomal protein S18 acetylase RimI-like enzyme
VGEKAWDIVRLDVEDEPPWDLLLDADPERSLVEDYWARGRAYAARAGDAVVGEAVFLPTRPLTWELVNVAVREDHRRQGLAGRLIRHGLAEAARAGVRVVEVGTADTSFGPLLLYLGLGFRIVGVDPDFFTRLYPEPVMDNGRQCRDMIRLALDLPTPRRGEA